MIFLLLPASSSFSQSVFTTKSLSQVTLTTEKQDRINRVGNLPHDGAMQYADVSTFITWGMLDNGTLSFSVPGQTGTYTATLMNSNYVSEQEYTYTGKINGSTNTNFAISRDEEGVTGFIGLSTGHYTFYPLGGNEVVLIKDALIGSVGPDCEVPSLDEGSSTSAESYCDNASNDCYAFIDIVVVVHSTAYGMVTPGFANLARINMNTVLLNSGIVNKEVRVRLVNATTPFMFPLTLSANNDLTTLSSSSGVKTFRENAGADILVLLIGAPYGGFPTLTFGIAYATPSNKKSAYAIVASPYAFGSRLTFPHEVAHCLGALHNRSNNGGDDDTDDCAHGLTYTGGSGTVRNTVLAFIDPFGERIPYYSNPNVTFDGMPTGIEGTTSTNTANNTRKIKNAACHVQNNYNPQQIYAQIKGPDAMCPGDNIHYESLVTPGVAQGSSGWSCGWTYSLSPSGPFTLLNTATCDAWVSANLGAPGSYIYLRLTVFPNTGNTWTTTKRILIHSSCFQGGGGLEDRNFENKEEFVSDESIYLAPNPAGGSVTAGIKKPGQLIEQIVVFSANGCKVLESKIGDKGIQTVTLDLTNIPTGLYYVRFVTNSGVFTKVLSHLND